MRAVRVDHVSRTVLLCMLVGMAACRPVERAGTSATLAGTGISVAAAGEYRGAGRRGYQAEIRVERYPSSADEVLRGLAIAAESLYAVYQPCSIFFRVHSSQSQASEDVTADLGTALARVTNGACFDGGTPTWSWESHVRLEAAPRASRVAASSETVFGAVPLPAGSTYLRTKTYPDAIHRVYRTDLSAEAIRDFYRQAMVRLGYDEDFLNENYVSFRRGKEYISIVWRTPGTFSVSKDK